MHTATWDEVVSAITGVKNRGSFSRTFTPTASAQSTSGQAGYYSSVYTACNAVSLTGNAPASYVFSGYTFYSNSLTRQTGTMADAAAYKTANLTAADSRPVLVQTLQPGDSKVWCIKNSDGVSRLCIQVPKEGFYNGSCCVAVATSTVASLVTGGTAGTVNLTNTGGWNGVKSVSQPRDGTKTQTYSMVSNIDLSPYNTVEVSAYINGSKDAYGSGGGGTITVQVLNASGGVLAQAAGSGRYGNAFNGTIVVHIEGVQESGRINIVISAYGGHAYKPNNDGKVYYSGNASIGTIQLKYS